jgi:hypothetical protein
MGTASRMGPGYFPFGLGILLVIIGVVVLIGSLRDNADDGEPQLATWDLKSLALILASVVLFGILLKPMGLPIAVAASVLVASFASHEFRWTTALINIVALMALSILVFVLGIGLEFNLLPAPIHE